MTGGDRPEHPTNGAHLRHHRIFKDLSDAELDQIFAVLELRHVRRRSTLFFESDIADRVCFFWSGLYHLVIAMPPSTTVTLTTFKAGSVAGLPLAAAGTRWGASLRLLCDEDGLILQIPTAKLTAFRHAMPTLADALLASLATLAADHAGRIFELSALSVRQRVHAELLRLARAGDWSGGNCIVQPAPTHQTLAGQVGSTREGVTRVLRELAADGLIRIEQRAIEFLDIDRLLTLDEAATGRRLFDPKKLG